MRNLAGVIAQLNYQGWECCYCGKPITPGQDICRAFDNSNICHTDCHSMGPAPEKED